MLNSNNPDLKSWADVSGGSDFPIQNLPFGVFTIEGKNPRVGVAIGDKILDLSRLFKNGLLNNCGLPKKNVFKRDSLNSFLRTGKEITRKVRERISELLTNTNPELRDNLTLVSKALIPMEFATMLLPVRPKNYTDFYSSIEHARNVGSMFRDPENALLPNWKHLPVGYHGRTSSILPSGTPIHRPKGQWKSPDADSPSFGPSKRLDFELEMAFITCAKTEPGESIDIYDTDNYIFGFVLFNDWSARDIQAWEYVPLGPFLGKNFASSVSPWVVTMDALEPFRTQSPEQDPEVFPYLHIDGNRNFDINLEVAIQPDGQEAKTVCMSNFKHMYWNVNQQLAHHTVNGCNIEVGDMYASGTISGPEPSSFGSMLELAWMGTKPIEMLDGTKRTFINDGDFVIMKGYSEKDGVRVGFGEVRAKVLPAK